MSNNIFIRAHKDYDRDYNIVETYIEDTALYLSKVNNQPLDVCKEFVRKTIAEDGSNPLKIPNAKWLQRGENGDRTKMQGPLTDYIKLAVDNGYIMSPTMALYKTPQQKKSLYADLMVINTDRRAKSKKDKANAIIDGNKVLAAYKEIEQSTFKIKNNSLSGAHASAFTMLFNPSAHSTLTSTCRTMTTTNNAHSERFLAGNRHYHSPAIAIANILSVINRGDIPRTQACLERYGLRPPTVEETHEVVMRSCNLYWNSKPAEQEIFNFISNLSDTERALYLYTSDLYSLNKCNKEFVETLLVRLSTRVTEGEDPTDINLLRMDEELAALLGSIFITEVKGTKIEKLMKAGHPVISDMRRTVKSIQETVNHYEEFFLCLLASNSPPSSMASFTSSIRRVVPVSDTDSTVYTVQDYVHSRYGSYSFSLEAKAYGAAVGFLNNKLTGHWLAMLSCHMGVGEDLMETLVMKNEFSFPVIFMTGIAKHYAMYIDGCEGDYYEKNELELKGVSFRSSKIPKVIRDRTSKLITDTMDDIIAEKPLDAFNILTGIADTERMILDSVAKGEHTFLSTSQVKEEQTYANPKSSPWLFKPFWDQVFGPKYGIAPEPPYQAVKVSMDTSNMTKVNEWIASLEDKSIGKRYLDFLKENDKKPGSYFLVPNDIAKGSGIPKELLQALDRNKLISGLMEGAYLAIESLGIYRSTPKKTELISDVY